MSSHGRDTYSGAEINFLFGLAVAFGELGVKTIHVGERAHEAFALVSYIAKEESGWDINLGSGYQCTEHFLTYVACALRMAIWCDNTMELRYHRVLSKELDGLPQAKLCRDIARAFIEEFPKNTTGAGASFLQGDRHDA